MAKTSELVSAGQKKEMTRTLVARYQQGDQSAFTDLYKMHFSKLNSYVAKKFFRGDTQQAEDITQIAFMKAAQALKDFRGDSEFATWLTTIAKNTAMHAYGKNKQDLSSHATVQEADYLDAYVDSNTGIEVSLGENPLDILQKQQAADVLQAYVEKRLKDNDMLAEGIRYLWRREAEHAPYQLIAQEAGIPIGTVRSRISRARDELERYMQPHYG